MIVVRLMGGLGNQMFQYAAGRALATRHATVLKLDLSFLERTPPGTTVRNYLLDRFPIVAERAVPSDFPCLEDKPLSVATRAWNALLRVTGRQCGTVLLDFDHNFVDSFFSAPKHSYLVGYWQSEGYFRNIRHLLLREFATDSVLGDVNPETVRAITTTCSVAIHVRRGDYVGTGGSASFHGICSLDYYRRAAVAMAKSIYCPNFFVFSDEPEWVRENFELSYPYTIVDRNQDDDPVGDLGLMSLCKHHIIANSSFSWWGAWLNENPGKKIIAPSRWFAGGDHIHSEKIIPEAWIRL